MAAPEENKDQEIQETKDNKKGLKKLMPYLAVVLFAGIAVLLVAILTKPAREEQQETTTVPIESTTEEATEETLPTAAALDVGRIETLMDQYYQAKVQNDVDTLNRIIESDTVYTLADLTGESQYIDRYDHFRNYVMPGLTEEYFVVYVTYDLYFRGIDTGAPALNRFIVAKDTDKNYFIYDRSISKEFEAYLKEMDGSPTIAGLRKEVEDGLDAACKSDVDLNELIRLLNGETKAPENGSAAP